jgi:hypothetical protein
MPTTFRVRRRADGVWTADHKELDRFYMEYHGDTYQDARQALFPIIEEQLPGEYTLDMPLDDAKKLAFEQIDARTTALIDAGFVFEDVRFSCSVKAQVRYSTMLLVANTLAYPLPINSLDDLEVLELQDSTHTTGFCIAALNHVRAAIDSGTAQKDTVRAMTDVETVLDHVDPRPMPQV